MPGLSGSSDEMRQEAGVLVLRKNRRQVRGQRPHRHVSKQSEDSGPALRNSNALDTIRHASAAGDSGWTTFNSSPVYQTHGSDLSRLTIETILSWSVFEGKYDAGPSLTDLLSSPTTLSQEPFLASIDPRHERLDLDLRTCTRLLHTFLEEVHIANPILDGPLVTGYLYQACIHGIGWDAPSCLVLLICALGAISESFHEHHEASSMTARQSPTFHLGQRYFEAAQMRLGAVLRTHGVLEAQCFFYSGVYLMAIFQPLRAWRCFVQAAAMAETLLFSYGGNSPHAAGARLKSETRCLETTHWACLKSELELRLELGLNQPDPLGFTYPTFFPTVPMQQLNRDESRVWYFYLAETAVRRLTMRIMHIKCARSRWILKSRPRIGKETPLSSGYHLSPPLYLPLLKDDFPSACPHPLHPGNGRRRAQVRLARPPPRLLRVDLLPLPARSDCTRSPAQPGHR
ncbi:hypothetical protein BA78_6374 [Aspergillus fumigatus]|nr:hypothetical protein BA78_6374 [Aspergillus fumigatus]